MRFFHSKMGRFVYKHKGSGIIVDNILKPMRRVASSVAKPVVKPFAKKNTAIRYFSHAGENLDKKAAEKGGDFIMKKLACICISILYFVYFNLYGDIEQLSSKPKFKVGDKVRISKYKRKVFDKGYTPDWTEEIFLIDKIHSTNPITYRLKDLNNEVIQGSFYQPELLKAKQYVFRIDKVIRRDYKKKQAVVKLLGYSDDFNSWIPFSDLQDLSN